MKLKYINKIAANLYLNINRKSSCLLDGSYNSIFVGRSMNFDNLREYVVGDNIKDIDWKASTRVNSLLVKQFIAERKHNVYLVFDTNISMNALSKDESKKKDLALYAAGTFSYLVNKNGDFVGAFFNEENKIKFYNLKSGLENIESILTNYDKIMEKKNVKTLNDTLQFLVNNSKTKAMVVIFTDVSGIDKLDESLLKKLLIKNDVLIFNIEDMPLKEDLLYDIEDNYLIPDYILKNKSIYVSEKNVKEEVSSRIKMKLKKYGVNNINIDSMDTLAINVIKLVKEHNYANKS